MNWRNYNSFIIIYITWSYYVFTAQLKFNVHIYKINENIYNVVKLSPHIFYSLI